MLSCSVFAAVRVASCNPATSKSFKRCCPHTVVSLAQYDCLGSGLATCTQTTPHILKSWLIHDTSTPLPAVEGMSVMNFEEQGKVQVICPVSAAAAAKLQKQSVATRRQNDQHAVCCTGSSTDHCSFAPSHAHFCKLVENSTPLPRVFLVGCHQGVKHLSVL